MRIGVKKGGKKGKKDDTGGETQMIGMRKRGKKDTKEKGNGGRKESSCSPVREQNEGGGKRERTSLWCKS